MGYHHELKNRFMHVDYKNLTLESDPPGKEQRFQSADERDSKCKNCTLEELAIINEIKKDPAITQKELARRIGKSERTIKTRTVEMQEKKLIRRENGKRNGKWELPDDVPF